MPRPRTTTAPTTHQARRRLALDDRAVCYADGRETGAEQCARDKRGKEINATPAHLLCDRHAEHRHQAAEFQYREAHDEQGRDLGP